MKDTYFVLNYVQGDCRWVDAEEEEQNLLDALKCNIKRRALGKVHLRDSYIKK